MDQLKKEEYINKFKEIKKRNNLLSLIFIPGFMILVFTNETTSSSFYGISNITRLIIGFLLIFGGGILSIINRRCPNCNATLGRTRNPNFCEKCGIKLKADLNS